MTLALTQTIEEKRLSGASGYNDVDIYMPADRTILGLHYQLLEKINARTDRTQEKRQIFIKELTGIYEVENKTVNVTADYILGHLINIDRAKFETLDRKLKKEIIGRVLNGAEQRGGINCRGDLNYYSREMARDMTHYDINGIYSFSADLISEILERKNKTKIERKEIQILLPDIAKIRSKEPSLLGRIKRFFTRK